MKRPALYATPQRRIDAVSVRRLPNPVVVEGASPHSDDQADQRLLGPKSEERDRRSSISGTWSRSTLSGGGGHARLVRAECRLLVATGIGSRGRIMVGIVPRSRSGCGDLACMIETSLSGLSFGVSSSSPLVFANAASARIRRCMRTMKYRTMMIATTRMAETMANGTFGLTPEFAPCGEVDIVGKDVVSERDGCSG